MEEGFQPYRSGKIRFFVLFLVSMIVFGNHYAFNNPQALEEYMEADLNIGNTQFQLLYSIFAFPNIFATFFIGFLIDYFGVRVGLVSLSGSILFFQFTIAMGGYAYSYSTILIGRLLFGLASGSLIIALASIVSFWFKGKEMAFAFGIIVTFPELGNALNSWATPLIYEATNSLGTALLVSDCLCLVGFACAVTAACIDKRADQYDEAHKIVVVESQSQAEGEGEGERIKCSDVKRLSWTFYLLVAINMLAVGLYVPFMDGANKLFIERFCYTPVEAGRALVVTYVISAVFSAPLGLLIDRFGYKRYLIMLCMLLFSIAQLIILVYPQCPEGAAPSSGAVAGLVFIGFGYCFYGNCVIPAVPVVVNKKITGTAFGILQMIEYIALASFPYINGTIIESGNKDPNDQKGYIHSSLFFMMVSLVGVLSSVGLIFIPDKYKRRLDRKSQQQMKLQHGEHGELYFSAQEDSDYEHPPKQIEIVSVEKLNQQLLNQSHEDKINNDL